MVQFFQVDTVSIQYRYGIDAVPLLYRYSIDTVSIQYRYCMYIAWVQYRYYVDAVSILYRYSWFWIHTHSCFICFTTMVGKQDAHYFVLNQYKSVADDARVEALGSRGGYGGVEVGIHGS